MKNRLISDEKREEYKAMNPIGYQFPETRCSGKTTGLAFLTIGKAMTSPGTSIFIRDHHRLRISDKELCNLIKSKIKQVGLEYLDITKDDDGFYLTYNVFE